MQDLIDRWAVDVPPLPLTATSPPFMVATLRDVLGCRSSSEEIRASTRRREISYKVIEMEDDGDMIAELYHGRVSPEVDEGIYRDWKKGKFTVLVATSALGMGVDYTCVRFVFHQRQSDNLMDFSQES
jgi:superfamily II DNA helicase RecQ